MSNESQTHVEASASEEESQKGMLSRRRLLKTILATGGAVAASTLLPSKWAEPVVEVGLLPAHAQVTEPTEEPTEEPARYSLYCDSLPGGGELTAGSLSNVTSTLELSSGSGPIEGVDVTIACTNPLINFVPALPPSAATNASGVASFGDFAVSGQPGTTFFLQYSCVDPVNSTPLSCQCGEYVIAEE